MPGARGQQTSARRRQCIFKGFGIDYRQKIVGLDFLLGFHCNPKYAPSHFGANLDLVCRPNTTQGGHDISNRATFHFCENDRRYRVFTAPCSKEQGRERGQSCDDDNGQDNVAVIEHRDTPARHARRRNPK